METGYDYLLLRWPLWQRLVQGSGVILIIMGAVLLSTGIAYYAYAHYARSSLDDLNFSVAATAGTGAALPSTGDPEDLPRASFLGDTDRRRGRQPSWRFHRR